MTTFATDVAATAGNVDSTVPSTTKWHPVRNVFAEYLGLDRDDVYVSTISDPSNVSPRFGQSDAARAADVLVAMYTGKSNDLAAAVRALEKRVAKSARVGIIARDGGTGWSVEVVLGSPGDPDLMTAASAWPNVTVVSL